MTLRNSGAASQVGNKTSASGTPANGQDDNGESLPSLTTTIVRIQKQILDDFSIFQARQKDRVSIEYGLRNSCSRSIRIKYDELAKKMNRGNICELLGKDKTTITKVGGDFACVHIFR
jgi:hypothetical protein